MACRLVGAKPLSVLLYVWLHMASSPTEFSYEPILRIEFASWFAKPSNNFWHKLSCRSDVIAKFSETSNWTPMSYQRNNTMVTAQCDAPGCAISEILPGDCSILVDIEYTWSTLGPSDHNGLPPCISKYPIRTRWILCGLIPSLHLLISKDVIYYAKCAGLWVPKVGHSTTWASQSHSDLPIYFIFPQT